MEASQQIVSQKHLVLLLNYLTSLLCVSLYLENNRSVISCHFPWKNSTYLRTTPEVSRGLRRYSEVNRKGLGFLLVPSFIETGFNAVFLFGVDVDWWFSDYLFFSLSFG